MVGDEVAERGIDLVTDGRHRGPPTARNGARDPLVVERAKILLGAPATPDDYDVRAPPAVQTIERDTQRLGAPSPCTRAGTTTIRRDGERCCDDRRSMSCNAAPSTLVDDRQTPRRSRERAFPLGRQHIRRVEPLERALERLAIQPVAFDLERSHPELHFATRGVRRI